MIVGFQLTESEFVRGHRVHLRRSLLTIKNFVALTVVLLFAALQAALFGGEDWALRVFGAIWAAILVFVIYAYVQVPRNLYRRTGWLAEAQQVELSERGVDVRGGGSERQYGWQDFSQSFENDEFFFLLPRGKLLILIPKRALDPSTGLAEIRAFLEADSAGSAR